MVKMGRKPNQKVGVNSALGVSEKLNALLKGVSSCNYIHKFHMAKMGRKPKSKSRG